MTPESCTLPRWLTVSVAAALILILLAILAIALGSFDPEPSGILAETLQPGLRRVGPEDQTLEWMSTGDATTLRLTAAFLEGETDSGYGLAVGNAEHQLVVAVSPLGYAAVWEGNPNQSEPTYRFNWQPWPHVRTGTEPNEIWVAQYVVDGRQQIIVRLNRELFWQGDTELLEKDAGLWLGSFGQAAAVDFSSLEIFSGS